MGLWQLVRFKNIVALWTLKIVVSAAHLINKATFISHVGQSVIGKLQRLVIVFLTSNATHSLLKYDFPLPGRPRRITSTFHLSISIRFILSTLLLLQDDLTAFRSKDQKKIQPNFSEMPIYVSYDP